MRTAGICAVVGDVADADVREVGAACAIAVIGAVRCACEELHGSAQQSDTGTVLPTRIGLHPAILHACERLRLQLKPSICQLQLQAEP
jgi:hypothetical protein